MTTARRHFLITYDVSDDKRRNRVFETLRDHGDHVQYSVFLCDLNPTELALLRGRLCENINLRDDQVLILDLGLAENSLDQCIECVGQAYHPPQRVMVV